MVTIFVFDWYQLVSLQKNGRKIKGLQGKIQKNCVSLTIKISFVLVSMEGLVERKREANRV